MQVRRQVFVERLVINGALKQAGEADAITLDGGDIYTAGLNNYNLEPIIAEDYGTSSETCYYAVAVVKKGHYIWHQRAPGEEILPHWPVSNFFSASRAPARGSKLCQLCRGDCSWSHNEPYYGYAGGFQCLKDGAGDVAFVKHLTVPDSEKQDYELLCKDDTRAPIDDYRTCHRARAPAHCSRQPLNSVQDFQLFSSENYAPSKKLMFKDSTVRLVRLPASTDSFLYLGAEYMSIVRSLKKEPARSASSAIKWCAVGHAETTKCDMWSFNSEECVKKMMRKEADAMAVDGGQVYTAGKCGLVPAMVEQYSADFCSNPGGTASYFAVAVVKKSSGLTWDTLESHRSCHTGLGRTAGWNIPMGQIHKQTQDCDFTQFFSSGCAPGSDPSSPFCSQCAGSGNTVGDESKCSASAEEQYNGYAGALRCLVEDAENSNGNGPAWASGVNADDYQLICPGQAAPVETSEYAKCNLAAVPAHAVVTRPETHSKAAKFGSSVSDAPFRMFQSDSGKNLLFKDSTKCLQTIPAGTSFETFVGAESMTAMNYLRKCGDTTPDLEKSCIFHSCQQKH
ncbi:hypothetical protein JOQ06_023147 [Pogonophryne albipinna]|uniref:Serotransferrin n=1 Tax=Pogonophryne albipinna TaxID=1090488 RepID=A0AAD6BMC8_9TELE|nr:hypothetical protein JOQ06_023147 [Pogonophryne albipinna]